MNRSYKATGFALVLALDAATMPCRADDEPPVMPGQRVDVTGSLMRQLDVETSLPITVLRADNLARAGVRTLEDALQFIASNQTIVSSAQSVGGWYGGAAWADLHGIGVGSTLVLLNGQRIVRNPYRGFGVDMNAIPMVLVDRIEILADGASPIYGSDAMAGVINIITRRDYDRAELSVSLRAPEAAGGNQRTATLTWGRGKLAGNGFNLYAGADFARADRIRAADRDYARAHQPERGISRTSMTTFPANYSQSSRISNANPSLPGCNPPASMLIREISIDRCQFDAKQYEDLAPAIERWALLAGGSIAIGGDRVASLEYVRAHNRLVSMTAPVPMRQISLPPSSPYFPGGAAGVPITDPALDRTRPIAVRWRTVEAGTRETAQDNVTQRLLARFEGHRDGWRHQFAAHRSEADVAVEMTEGWVDLQKIVAGLQGLGGAPFLNPFGPQSAEGAAYLESSRIIGRAQIARGSLQGASVIVDGELVSLPAGALRLAVGADARRESVEFRNDFGRTRQAESSPLMTAEDLSGRERHAAIFGEFELPLARNRPLAKRLDMTLSLRHERNDATGGTSHPKLSWRWQPTQPLVVRGSWNRGFAAAPIFARHEPSSVAAFAPAGNSLLCNGRAPVAGVYPGLDCSQTYNVLRGGNPDVRPTTSRTRLAGFVLQLGQLATLSVDRFETRQGDSIWFTTPTQSLADPKTYGDHLIRCGQLSPERAALFGCDPSNPDALAYIDGRWENIGTTLARGVDIALDARTEASHMGRLSVAWNGTYWSRLAVRPAKTGDFIEYAGRYVLGVATPRWQHVMQVGWERGSWSARLAHRYKRSYWDENISAAPGFRDNRVGAWSVFDATLTYKAADRAVLTAGVLNVADEKPPFSNQNGSFQTGYEPSLTSPVGRALFLQTSYRFW